MRNHEDKYDIYYIFPLNLLNLIDSLYVVEILAALTIQGFVRTKYVGTTHALAGSRMRWLLERRNLPCGFLLPPLVPLY